MLLGFVEAFFVLALRKGLEVFNGPLALNELGAFG